MTDLDDLNQRIVACTRCPRLVEYRERVARERRRMYRDWEYWGRPVPGFGDPNARALVIGLAPAAHGGNRTGRVFTGDRSGDMLYGALHRAGFASSPISRHVDDGMRLNDVYVTAAVRCAPPDNKPTPAEFVACRPYLHEELDWFRDLRAVVALGAIAFDAYLLACRERGVEVPRPKPRFAHAGAVTLAHGVTLLSSYHPSQRNTQTGRLTQEMFDGVFAALRRVLGTPWRGIDV